MNRVFLSLNYHLVVPAEKLQLAARILISWTIITIVNIYFTLKFAGVEYCQKKNNKSYLLYYVTVNQQLFF